MSFLSEATLSTEITWTQRDNTHGDSVLIDNGDVSYSYLFGSGNSLGNVNSVWYTSGVLSTGQQLQFDLFSLTRNVFGGSIVTNLSGGYVKALIVNNLSTGINQNIVFNSSGALAFNTPYQSGAVYLDISPESTYILINKFGYSVNTGQRYFYLNDAILSGMQQYEIAILGSV